MKIYTGTNDTSDKNSNSFLQLNHCGMRLPQDAQLLTLRKTGRKDYHIIYIADGHCTVEYDGKSYDIHSGFVIYPPHKAQKYIDYSDTKRFWLHFAGYSVEEILREAKLTEGVYITEKSPIAEKLLLDTISEFNKTSDISSEKSLLLSTLYTLGKLANNDSTDTNSQIKKAVNYICENFTSDMGIKELAKAYCLSPSRFIVLFKQETGCSPIAFRQSVRINYCINLLINTQLSVSDIGKQAGYDDPLYFSRIFKKTTGLSPKQYREAHTEEI